MYEANNDNIVWFQVVWPYLHCDVQEKTALMTLGGHQVLVGFTMVFAAAKKQDQSLLVEGRVDLHLID